MSRWRRANPAVLYPFRRRTLLADLVAYYSLEEASGVRVDASGNGRSLTDNNTVTQAVGKVGNAAQFTAANSESLSRVNDVLTGSEWTVALFVKFDTLAASRGIWTVGNTQLETIPQFLLQANGADLRLFVNPGGYNAFTGVALATGTWYHIAVTKAASQNIKGYVNGVERLSVTPASITGNATNLYLGAGFNAYHDGQIDETGIWSRALSASAITSLYNGGAGRAFSDLASLAG